MRAEVMTYYGFTKPFEQAGYYETDHYQQIFHAVKEAILARQSVALCGIVGSGKTTMIHRLRQQFEEEGRIAFAQSLALEKQHVTIDTLTIALLYDLTNDERIRIPAQSAKRERALRDLIQKEKRHVALFIDDAHGLKLQTLIDLKRLTEIFEDGGCTLSVVLSGHPTLQSDVQRAKEFARCTRCSTLDGIAGNQHEYISWLIGACTDGKVAVESMLTPEAVNALVSTARTPLRVQWYLTLAFEAGHRIDERPISGRLLESALPKQAL